MSNQPLPNRKHGLTAIDGALALIALLLIVQMWLLTATLESYLAGAHEAAIPAAVISGVLFLICGALYLFVARIDSEARRERSEPRPDAEV
jgi:pilus assembly protein TadC